MRTEWCALSVEASHWADAVRLVSMATSTSAQEGQRSTVDSECHFSIIFLACAWSVKLDPFLA